MSSSPSLPCPFFAIRSFLLCLFLLTLGIVRAAPVHEGLASFGSKPQLPSPGNLVLGPNDYFWGTTKGGGAFGQGAIYKVKADGSDWQTVVEFTGNGTTNKGGNPLAGLTFDNLNTFWGTTSSGGAFNYGTVFKFDATTGVLTTLVEFTGNGASEKGASPSGKLTRDSSGYYWGTTSGGGSSNLGTVFRVHIQSGSLTTAIEFTGNGASNKGSYPSSGLISDFAGNFWGMTENGGAGGSGTIFKINLSSGILTTVIEFTGETGANKGRNPAGDLTGNGSDFWGTTQNGGANGFGTVFKLNRTTGILTTVVEFTYNGASNKGQRPQTTLRLDGAGNFWGTTQTGGSYSQGTVFKLDSTTGTLTTVIEFTGNTFTNKGSTPQAGFSADSAGSLWSCTYWGGASGGGTVFKLNPATGVLTTVLEFPGGSFTKGTSPVAGLTPDGAGFLWGSTSTGGTTGLGTLFKIAAPAAPSLTASVLTTVVHFTGNGASNKGSAPQATLRPDGASNLWGATLTGGANGHGTVFKVNISTGVLTTLVEFTGNAATNKGSQPRAELLDDGSGFFWGTTSLGGAGDHGTVFKINTALGLLTTVAEFTGTGGATIGRTPCGGLVADGGGYLWGTTASGGTGGFGTVYKIHATSGAFTSVLEFTGNGASNKGAAPRSRLTPDGAGYLWGTTEDGALGDGTVFKVHIATGQMTTVVQFTGNGPTNRGNHPLAALTSDGSGRLWGSTRSGGTGGQGTVFSILTNTGVLTTELDLTGNGPQANNGSSPGSGALYFHSDGRLYGTTSDGGPNHDGTVFRLHFEGAPEIIVQGFDGSPLTDNVGSTAIGPVRLKTPFISTINIRNDGYFPLSVASIAISCDGSAPGPISLKDVRSYDSLGNLRWSQFGQLPPTIASGERVDVSFEIPPSQPGPHSFTIHISSDDSDENPFEIHLTANFTFQQDLLVAQPTTHNVLRFDGLTGEPRGAFIAAGSGGLDAPAQMTVGPDGKLYIADSVANVVKRFDLDGNFIDNFTVAGPLTNPVALRFGPDGKLYVLCGGTIRQIHRFHGMTGALEAMVVNASSIQLNSPKDFIFMPSTNDFLVTSATNAVARFNFTTGAFVSHYLNSSRSNITLNFPTGITIGPDGNYWVASSIGNYKITRFNITTGARIGDAFLGSSTAPSSPTHQEIAYYGGYLFVANGSRNSIVLYDAYQYGPTEPIQLAPTGSDGTSNGDGSVFVPQGSQGLTNPKNLLFAPFNTPPSTNAGVDQPASPGQIVNLTCTSSDPENLPLTYQWTQLSGTPVLSGSLLASGSTTSASLGFITPNSGGPLVFQLTVSDGVKSASDTVFVTINGTPVSSVPMLAIQAANSITTHSRQASAQMTDIQRFGSKIITIKA